MKRVFALCISVLIIFSFVGCDWVKNAGGKEDNINKNTESAAENMKDIPEREGEDDVVGKIHQDDLSDSEMEEIVDTEGENIEASEKQEPEIDEQDVGSDQVGFIIGKGDIYNILAGEIEVSLALVECEKDWDGFLMNDISDNLPSGDGMRMKPEKKKWVVGFKNNSDRQISDIQLGYIFSSYNYSEANKFSLYKQMDRSIYIQKIEGGKSILCDLFYMGTFPRVDACIESIVINGMERLELPKGATYIVEDQMGDLIEEDIPKKEEVQLEEVQLEEEYVIKEEEGTLQKDDFTLIYKGDKIVIGEDFNNIDFCRENRNHALKTKANKVYKYVFEDQLEIYTEIQTENSQEIVKKIKLSGSHGRTARGIEISWTEDDVKMAYGEADYLGEDILKYDYRDKRIIFYFDSENKIKEIEIKELN